MPTMMPKGHHFATLPMAATCNTIEICRGSMTALAKRRCFDDDSGAVPRRRSHHGAGPGSAPHGGLRRRRRDRDAKHAVRSRKCPVRRTTATATATEP